MPELVLSTATGILWYPAETIKCVRAWVAQQQSHTTKGGQNKAHYEQV